MVQAKKSQTETRTAEINGKIITWKERRLVVRSFKHAHTQEAALRHRLTKAETAITNLTIRHRGKKRITTLAELQEATDEILKRYKVEDLLDVQCTETIIEHHVRPYRNRPARTETESQLSVCTQIHETALKDAIHRLGWRVYATNALLSLRQY